jgi:hypothetical protein
VGGSSADCDIDSSMMSCLFKSARTAITLLRRAVNFCCYSHWSPTHNRCNNPRKGSTNNSYRRVLTG